MPTCDPIITRTPGHTLLRGIPLGVSTTLLERFNPGGRPLVAIGGLDKEPSQFFLTDPGNVRPL